MRRTCFNLWSSCAKQSLELIITSAENNKIPFQRAAASRSTGTDTDAFAYATGGVASALIFWHLNICIQQ